MNDAKSSERSLKHVHKLLSYLQSEVYREVVQLELQMRSIAQLYAEKRRQLDEVFDALARKLDDSRRALQAEAAGAVAAAMKRVRDAQEVVGGHRATANELKSRLTVSAAWNDGGWALAQLCGSVMTLKEDFTRAQGGDAGAQLCAHFAPEWPWPQVSAALAELRRQLPGADLSSSASFSASGLPDGCG